jgi:hypothetical protein
VAYIQVECSSENDDGNKSEVFFGKKVDNEESRSQSPKPEAVKTPLYLSMQPKRSIGTVRQLGRDRPSV